MMQAQMLLGAIAGARPHETRRRRWRIAGAAALMTLGLAGFVAACWVIVQAALYDWQTSDWDRLQAASLLPLPFVFLIAFPPLYALTPHAFPQHFTQPILDRLAAGDDSLASPTPLQPEPLTSSELSASPVSFRRLRPLESWREVSNRFPVFFVILPMQFALPLMQLPRALGIEYTWRPFGLSVSDILLPIFLLSLVGVFLALAISSRWPHRRLMVDPDETSVSWRWDGLRQPASRAPWASVRSYSRVAYQELYGTPRTAFVLDTGDATLAWVLTHSSKDEEYLESERLTRLIATRTGLPLRDLSPFVAKVAQTRGNLARLEGLGLPADALAGLADMRRRAMRQMWRGIAIVLAVFVLLLAGPLFASDRLQDYQRTYFAGLVPKLHAETPLYQDSLSADDGAWVVEQPGAADNQESHTFVDGAYQMSGQAGHIVDALVAPVYADAAVEVTARQTGSAQNDGVGLVVRADGDQNMVVFFASPTDGSWMLSQYRYNQDLPNDSWHWMDGGKSSVIQRGSGASNRLLVLTRGQTFILYINDRFVDAYIDTYHETQGLLSAGQVGVYLDEGGTTGSFTDFAVYPVQSPPSLSYV